jgi:hypothetical protein
LKLLLILSNLLVAVAPPPPAGADEHRTEVQAPSEEQAVWVLLDDELDEAGGDAREIMGRLPGITARSLGDSFALSTLQIRGAAPVHTRFFLDGIPLDRADGAPIDLSILPLWHARRLRVWPAHAPLGMGGGLGGAVALDSHLPRHTRYEIGAQGGSFQNQSGRLYLATAGAAGHVGLGVQAAGAGGGFPWFDDGRTAYDPSDDRWRTRENNDARRLSGLLRVGTELGRCTLRAIGHGLDQEQGVPGPAGRLSDTARYALETALGSLGLTCEGADWTATTQAAFRWMRARSDDSQGQISLVPTRATREAFAPAIRGGAWWRLHRRLDLGIHQEVVREDYELDDPLRPETHRTQRRTRTGSAVALRWRLPWGGLEFAPRLRLDALVDGEGETRLAPGWQAVLTRRAGRESGLEITLGLTTATRFPSLFERHGDGLFVAPALALQDERGTVGSLTARWEVLGLPRAWRIAVVTSGFVSRLDDVIQLRRNNLFTAVAENVGRATVGGGELAVESDLWRHVRVRLAATALETRMSSDEVAIDRKPLPLRPETSFYGRATVYEGWSGGDQIAAFVELDHRGRHTYDMAALVWAPPATEVGVGFQSALALGGLIGASGRLGLEARLMNAGDTHSVDLLGYPRPGRRWAAQLTWREEAF